MKRVLSALTVLLAAVFVLGGPATAQQGESDSTQQTQTEEKSEEKPQKDENGNWYKGNPEADVVLVEYADIQCPACRAYYPAVQKLIQDHPDELKVVFRHYPLTNAHPHAFKAAIAAEAAGRQGKFFPMLEMLYQNQRDWSRLSSADMVMQTFHDYAKQLELDTGQFMNDLFSEDLKNHIWNSVEQARSEGVNSTPTFVLNGEQIQPQNPMKLIERVKQAIRES